MIERGWLLIMAGSVLLSAPAWAGPNAGGTIFVHDADFIVQTDLTTFCGLGTPPPSCEAADVNLEGSTSGIQKLWKMYAAFPEGSSPRLKAMAFGVHYDPDVILTMFGPCVGDMNNGGAELPGPGWPGSDTGTTMVFQYTQTTDLVECYYFGGYNYYGAPIFQLRDNPDPVFGGNFADDSIPAVQDPIAGYGSMGLDTPGQVVCPEPELGACCLCGGECVLVSETECETLDGFWMGGPCDPNPCPTEFMGACCYPDGRCEFVYQCECPTGVWLAQYPCEPNPCEPNPVAPSTWGRVKSVFR